MTSIRTIQDECMKAQSWNEVDLIVNKYYETLQYDSDARLAVSNAYRRIYRVRKYAMSNTELIYKN